MRNLSVSESISQGWELAKKHGLLLAVFVLVIGIITNLLSSFTLPSGFMEGYTKALTQNDPDAMMQLLNSSSTSAASIIVSIIQTVVYVLFLAGFCATILKLTRGLMAKVSLDGFKMSAMTYLKFFAVSILVGLAVGIGTALCVIPGIFLAVRLGFAEWYILDHPEAGIGEALSASWKMTKGNFWSVLGLMLAEIGIIILGYICCCIGVLFAIPFAYFAESSAYMMLQENLAYENLDYAAPANEYQKDEH
ncbi:MAG: hypothetical protein IKH43_04990 [Bacteroidaceae bacterium]|nr:hypothetical protein [Bacteroidaceae bacterium]